MTIVFGGLDLPVFEILFIVSVLLILGLIIAIIAVFTILRELRSFKELLKEEEHDVDELDRDIQVLDALLSKKSGKQAQTQVKNYIKSAMKKGYKWPDIRKGLIARGWKAGDLDKWYTSL